MLEHEVEILKIEDDFTVYKVNFPEMDFLSYLTYQDENLFYSMDISNLKFDYMTNNDINNYREVTDEQVYEVFMSHNEQFKKKYEQGAKENNPIKSISYHNKRDLVTQTEMLFDSNKFTDEKLYDLLTYVYQTCEDGFDSLINLFEDLYSRNKELVNKIVEEELTKHGIVEEDIIVYRGFNPKNRLDGTSFTTSLKVAKQFADRWSHSEGDRFVNKYKVNRKRVLAYLDAEKEIVTDGAVLIEKDIKA